MQRVKIKNKVVGEYDEKYKVFHKKVKKSLHLMRKTNSWGLDYEHFKTLPDNAWVHIEDVEDKLHYFAEVKTIKDKGTFLNFGELQIFLELSHWAKEK